MVAFTGKAVTALGAWHEALALSAGRSLPMIFVVENNSRVKSAGARSDWEDFTQKAQSYGLPGITVDGNDVVAVYRVAHESLERVRQGDGPVLIEARVRIVKPGAASPILSPTWKSTSRPKSSSILAGKIGWSKNFRENLTPPPKRREKCNDHTTAAKRACPPLTACPLSSRFIGHRKRLTTRPAFVSLNTGA